MTIDRDVIRKSRGLTEMAACQRLERLARGVPANCAIVELGAYRGRTTGWLAYGGHIGKGATVVAIDPWEGEAPEDYRPLEAGYRNGNYAAAFQPFQDHLRAAGVEHMVTPLRGYSTDIVKHWTKPIGLLYHDALHTFEAVRQDLQEWSPFVVPGGWVACHDLGNASFGVERAAAEVLDNDSWNWAGRERRLWKKDPTRRGLLAVQRRR